MTQLAWLAPLLPGATFLLVGLVTHRQRALSSALSIGAVAACFAISILIVVEVGTGARYHASLPWLGLGEATLTVGFSVDPLAAVMLFVVTSVSLLVQVYSLGYMRGDRGWSRYFAFMSLFTMSMLGVVLASNLVTLYVFWELVGLCSYLLIGHWYEKPEAAAAARKAFVTTRFGDFGFLVGIVLLWSWSPVPGTLEFSELARHVQAGAIPAEVAALAALLVFAGAVGKSAQFPLHVWLPDAMEGPTPVSALIHAATMVAAGVYLVARSFEIFAHSPAAMLVVAVIGGFTAVFAATMALVNNDIKRVLAFSTVSQLGYMMLGLGAFSLVAGMFHLFTHAFFKALLFLAAGSVIHSAHTQDLRHMGGLRSAMPITFWTMLIGALSLVGLFPLAGFWSKDEVLLVTVEQAGKAPLYWLLFGLAAATVFLTAFYMFRAIFLAFFGLSRSEGRPRESPPVMTWPLILLAIPSVLAGFWGSPLWPGVGFAGYLQGAGAHPPRLDGALAALSTALALAGIGLAYLMYVRGAIQPVAVGRIAGPLFTLLERKYFVDEAYGWLIGKVVLGGSVGIHLFDRYVIDGIVNGVGSTAVQTGAALRQLQTGRVQAYGLALFAGAAVIAVALLVSTPAR